MNCTDFAGITMSCYGSAAAAQAFKACFSAKSKAIKLTGIILVYSHGH